MKDSFKVKSELFKKYSIFWNMIPKINIKIVLLISLI